MKKRSKMDIHNRQNIRNKYGDKCWYCGISIPTTDVGLVGGSGGTVDHIIPKAKGGSNDEDNLALACGWCNRAKVDSDVVEFLTWMSHIRSSSFDCFILRELPKGIINEIDDQVWDKLRKW